jgi:nicotinate phosphoribosyltransferase
MKRSQAGFNIASADDILSGKTTDVYFVRTQEILKKQKIRKRVSAEFSAKNLQYPWGVFCGLDEIINLLKHLPVKIKGLPEGTIFRKDEPVLTIEGDYLDFGLYETALLGLMCQASGIATKSARLRLLAGNKSILSFGARRMHPATAPMIERSAYIGGCDGVSVIKSAELIGIPPSGTMPHAFILIVGDEEKAYRLFHKFAPKEIPRVALIDTFSDEKFGALKAVESLKSHLYAVRLDTPSSRKGNWGEIIEEVRWELKLRHFEGVKIFLSGGIDEKDVSELAPHVDGFGIGTSISNAPVINFSMDIVEIDGKPIAKRGKPSGEKRVVRCSVCFNSLIQSTHEKRPRCRSCPKEPMIVLTQVIPKTFRQSAEEIRRSVLSQLKHLAI